MALFPFPRFKGNPVHWCTGARVHGRLPFSVRLPLSPIRKTAFVLLIAAFQISCSEPRVSVSPRLPDAASAKAGSRVETDQAPPSRIVSLAPSITEMLFELGLGDRVAGVTRYCDYPPEAAGKPVVGGYFDVNYEALLSLSPDLVILLEEHTDAVSRLSELGVPALTVNHSRVGGILDSITLIAASSGVPERGEELRRSLEARIETVTEGAKSSAEPPPAGTTSPPCQDPPRVLVVVGRLMDDGPGGEMFVSGRDGYYDDLIRLAGGVNAYTEETLKFPAISDEGLVRLDPDIIIEMIPGTMGGPGRNVLMEHWRRKGAVSAVRGERVHIIGADYAVVPGPRFVLLLEEMAGIIGSCSGRPGAGVR